MPSYKLTYFNRAGRAEPIRVLLNYGNIPFEDYRISFEEWEIVKSTTPFGRVPILEIDDLVIPQSDAIRRYVADLVGLAGKNAEENVAIDVAVGALEDLYKMAVDIAFCETDEKKKECQDKFREYLAVVFKKLDADAGKNGGYLALDRPTWVDIEFICSYERFVNALGEDVLGPYPNLQQVKKNVLSIETIRNYIKNRPEKTIKAAYELKQDL